MWGANVQESCYLGKGKTTVKTMAVTTKLVHFRDLQIKDLGH